MHPRRFLLHPFPGEAYPAGLAIGGSVARRADTLSIRFEVRGNLSKVSIPSAAEEPRRRDRLWEETCLELFLGIEDSGSYWEFNLSPAGHWNVYRFTRYREGMREEPAIPALPFDVGRNPEALTLTAKFDIGKIVPACRDLATAIAAVIETTDGGKSHWALTHPGPRPDFHRRDGFALILPC
ncbi:DOMON-like domain-containing protein [Candidatus Deferrimicrobium sp.]|uniref:DOMON-like domain-containing protein n=1 Tax=Candidatus Deferrimicrobium sp. TaxID=3060586 RepID=UPI003C6A7F80